MGKTYSERGLTFVTVNLAGHEIPQYVAGAGYRQLEFLLGRISSLTQGGDFTTQTGNYTGTTPPSPFYSDTSSSAAGTGSTVTKAVRHRRTGLPMA